MIPHVVIIAGPNGSGKSTLTQELQGTTINLPANYINADEIAKQMQSEMPTATQLQREQEAFFRARALRQRYLLSTETPQMPNEQNGTYEGMIRAVLPGYGLQELNGSAAILHDRLLLTDDVQQNSLVRITYTDGVGHVTED